MCGKNKIALSVASAGAKPRLESRLRNCSRARDSRLSTVPTGQPRRRATSSWCIPCRWQRTKGTR